MFNMKAFNLYHYSICTCVDKNKLQARNIYNAEINTWCQNIDPVGYHQNIIIYIGFLELYNLSDFAPQCGAGSKYLTL